MRSNDIPDLDKLVYASPPEIVSAVERLVDETQLDWDVLSGFVLPSSGSVLLVNRDKMREAVALLWLAMIVYRFDGVHDYIARKDLQRRFREACTELGVTWSEVVRLLPRVNEIRVALLEQDEYKEGGFGQALG